MAVLKTMIYRMFLINLFIIMIINGTAQNIPISTRLECIKIENDTSFIKNISISLKKNENDIVFPVFYDDELETVSNLKLYTKKGKRFKLFKNPFIVEEEVDFDYITSKKIKSIVVPANTEANITYTVKCNELMYFTDLHFFSYNDTDTLKYQIEIPESYHLLHNMVYTDSLNYLKIDSVNADTVRKWDIKVKPVKVEPDPLMFFGFYKNLRVPLMRVIVVPKAYANKGKDYMNNWYLQKLQNRQGLNAAAKQKIDDLTEGKSDPVQVLETLYNYVNNYSAHAI